jgi:hypothetical protein
MTNDSAPSPVAVHDVQKMRQRMGLPWLCCKQHLESLSPTDRRRYLTAVESQPSGILHDPIEDDPAVRPLFLAICDQAKRDVEAWHRQHIVEFEETSPAVADLFRSGRGLCHRIWDQTKSLLKARHGIDWLSPREMNPGIVFD